jgi:hypothetical protein
MIEAVARIVRMEEELQLPGLAKRHRSAKRASTEAVGASTSTAFSAQRHAAAGDGLLKYALL